MLIEVAISDDYITPAEERYLLECRKLLGLTDEQCNKVLRLLNLTTSEYAEFHKEIPSSTCVVCLNNPIEMIILPCYHYCLCSSCSGLMEQSASSILCPLCQCTVEKIERVYR